MMTFFSLFEKKNVYNKYLENCKNLCISPASLEYNTIRFTKASFNVTKHLY